AGKAVAIAGISAASLAMLMPMTSEAQNVQEPHNIMKGSMPVLTDTITVRGIAFSVDTLLDGTISKEPLIGATIFNRRMALGTYADLDGHFILPACIGDTLEVRYVGYEPQTIVITEGMRNVEITLTPSQAVMGEYVVVLDAIREEKHYFDLNVVDENGNPIHHEDLLVWRVWIDDDGEEDYKDLSPQFFDQKHPCRIYWDYDYGLKDKEGKPLKEAMLRIEADGYDDPVIIKVKYPKRNAKRTIKFKHKKK
ncbi:carboxypeptidase-like regulatory domain-containing protein, partial [uncultured Duncaniella sp.]